MFPNSQGGNRSEVGARHISALALLVAVVLWGGLSPAVAQIKRDKKELYKLAEIAATAGKVEESQKLYCQVAKMDPGFKDAKMLCAVMTEELERERKKNDERFSLGVKDFNERRYDEAQHEFSNIHWGAHVEEARLYLNTKIPEARESTHKPKGPEKRQ